MTLDEYMTTAAIALNNLQDLPEVWANIYTEISEKVPEMVDFVYRIYSMMKIFAVIIALLAVCVVYIFFKVDQILKDTKKLKEMVIFEKENRL